ncbi:DUF2169 domain-containing protein [Vitiosangium sp. GDMCC 1.1324]|uniref:DUF2169 family type VI secretion system accessory protein n=1 Tax=Vitiosangium sp. (strain GDMCC 1.1324) TaxID=2138576 RepID=UPI000D3B5C32|nr:DUF2169 domain-containing protein [Vitiosangium sp. GDMCC 1.1324]PTL77833.1 DUF2169 domain-containing protein [Vitiosangium sp. GDMCC 1.1324]
MLQARNETPFTPGMFLFPNEQGVDTLYVVVKATFDLRQDRLSIARKQCPLVMADEYWGEPGASSLKYANEAHLLKPGTDVVVVGEAHAPRGRPVETCLVSVKVGPLHQVVQVFGDRTWRGGLLSPTASAPEPFITMPLVYERAFGGTHELEGGQVLAEPSNPVGQGFRGKRSAREMVGQALPNLEDPRHLIGGISDTPAPVGWGPVAPAWMPRKAYAGTYDEQWKARRAPYLPLDFRPEFFQVAPPPLCASKGLKGGELVELINLSPDGPQRFALPRCELDVTVRIARRPTQPHMRMETVLLEPGERRLILTWRGAVECDKRSLKVEEALFQVKSLKGAGEQE